MDVVYNFLTVETQQQPNSDQLRIVKVIDVCMLGERLAIDPPACLKNTREPAAGMIQRNDTDPANHLGERMARDQTDAVSRADERPALLVKDTLVKSIVHRREYTYFHA